MKKTFKKIKLLVIIALVFTLTGCKNRDVNNAIRHAGFAFTEEQFTCDQFLPTDDNLGNYEKIWIFNENKIITKNGVVYDRSKDKPFSNEKYCKISNFTKRATAILDNNIIKGNDNHFYYLQATDKVQAFTKVSVKDSNFQLYQLLLGQGDVIKAITVDAGAGIYYVLKRDGNIYKYNVIHNDNVYTLRSKEILYSKGSYGGNIVDFYFSPEIRTNYIRTETRLYREIASNNEECTKYADIICKYNMIEDIELEKFLDRLIAYDGSTIITDYGAVFTMS